MNSQNVGNIWRRQKFYYFLMLPGLLYFFIFHYIPMFGVSIAFKDITPFDGIEGIFGGEWVGLAHFKRFFDSYYFWNVLGNTVIISLYKLFFGFPAPILLALLLNEVTSKWFKKSVQTISYLPHFISMVVVAGLLTNLLSTDNGILNAILSALGKEAVSFLGEPAYFRTILVISDVWQSIGWGSILYLAAMAGIDPQLYEAAKMDGANRLRQMWHITLPGISFVVSILLILNVGKFLEAGFEQIFLLYSPSVYQVADIIDTYVYRQGLLQMQYSFAAAIGVFKNIVGMVLILLANYIVKKMDQPGLW
ncbi:ABC transporter permease subunit [Paenibacillus sp. WQ 127069]|uniref:ABC transporter permease subunit n=1 Tax=Paenibacillus baimaensis TaxID=2982185 RepID=A0ABT2U9V0_9BACL|nr:ABC transporter permease subunit [Paenibacillus sp. WQ 127069]MCU6791405.1 ABC transporter permease subunit [Paenibacillus sp. WQ 127069]